MPIFGPTPINCFEMFRAHLGRLMAGVFSPRMHVAVVPSSDASRASVGFREGRLRAAPIDTRYGRVYFYAAQALECQEEPDRPANERFRLRTSSYWYRLQNSPEVKAQAVIRWEYARRAPRNGYCRHHVQMPAGLELGDDEIDLNRAHLPCGWVTIEEVLRFLIVDLGFQPPCGDRWPEVVAESERKFFEEFTGKRYSPPTGEEG